MKKRLLTAVFLLLLISLPALAEETPEWEYPIAPEILADPEGYITLTNQENLLDADYVPRDLITVTVKRVVNGELRKAAHEALEEMFAAAEKDGCTLYAKSLYRSYQTQKTMYSNRLQKVGRDDGVVAYPGSSDHQTGLGIDILNYEWTKKDGMTPAFAETREAQWMAAHCHEYGFIVRYMEDKEEITGIIYEPWHLRFVGNEAAVYIMENHLSLEEFTREWRDYVAMYEADGGDFEALVRNRTRVNDAYVLEVTEDGEEELSIF